MPQRTAAQTACSRPQSSSAPSIVGDYDQRQAATFDTAAEQHPAPCRRIPILTKWGRARDTCCKRAGACAAPSCWRATSLQALVPAVVTPHSVPAPRPRVAVCLTVTGQHVCCPRQPGDHPSARMCALKCLLWVCKSVVYSTDEGLCIMPPGTAGTPARGGWRVRQPAASALTCAASWLLHRQPAAGAAGGGAGRAAVPHGLWVSLWPSGYLHALPCAQCLFHHGTS